MLIVILALEIIFYSLFVKFSKKDGNIIGYAITFILGTIEMYMLDSEKLLAYLLFFVIALLGMRIIGRTTVYKYDILMLFMMCLFKLVIEIIFTSLLHIAINDVYLVALIVSVVKISIIVLLRNKINTLYNKGRQMWDNNNFYIRYTTSTLIMIYIIATCVLLIVKLI